MIKNLPDYYTTLSEAMVNALKALEQNDPVSAKAILKQGQLQSEKQYLAAGGNLDSVRK